MEIEKKESIDRLFQQINEIISDVDDVTSHLGDIEPPIKSKIADIFLRILSFLPIISWGVYFYTEHNFQKFANRPFYKDYTPYNYAFYIYNCIVDYIEKEKEIQKLCNKEEEEYYKGINESLNLLLAAFSCWREMNIWAERYEIDKVCLAPQIAYQIKSKISEINLPPEWNFLKEENKELKGNGCLGMMIALISLPSTIAYLILS